MTDDKAAPKRGRRASPTKDDGMNDVIAEIRATQEAQALILADIEARTSVLEIAAPAITRALSIEELDEEILKDRNRDLEVLERWTFLGEVFKPGRRLKASYYSNILDFVRAGLKLGLPIDGGRLNAAAAEARDRAHQRSGVH